jgi:putative NADH-flavin reductase
MKQVTVFGANGNIGSRLVRLLLENDYKVVAFVHGTFDFPKNSNLKIVRGDIYEAAQVKRAVKGSDIVVSTLGSWGAPKKDVVSSGMRTIIPAMNAYGISRIVTLTGADARDPHDKPTLSHKITHALFGAVVIKILKDGETHMRLLRESNLDWTTLRSPVMNETGGVGNYTLRFTLPGLFETIHRDDVAAAMLWLVETGQYSRRAPIIYRS